MFLKPCISLDHFRNLATTCQTGLRCLMTERMATKRQETMCGLTVPPFLLVKKSCMSTHTVVPKDVGKTWMCRRSELSRFPRAVELFTGQSNLSENFICRPTVFIPIHRGMT